MAVSLQDAIAQSIGFEGYGQATINMSMQDADGPLLWGVAVAHFVWDLPLRDAPVRVERGTTATTGLGRLFTRQPTPGFSTREPASGDGQYQVVNDPHVTTMDMFLRRDPGIPIMQWARGGPSVQIEIEAGPRAVSLNADEDGLYLRAVGPSIADPTHQAAYTVSISSVIPWAP
jgi:hypothetical protein